MLRFISISLVSAFLCVPFWGATQDNTQPQTMIPGTNISTGSSGQAINQLSQAAEVLYQNQLPEQEILALLSRTIDAMSAEAPGRTRELLRAQALLLRATFLLQHDRKELAEKDLVLTETIIQSVFDPPDAIAYQLLANVRSNLLLTRGFLYMIANAAAANDLALKAIEMDPDNIVGTIIVAYGKIKTPQLFGGSPEAGREMLQKLLDRPTLGRPFRFAALLGISEAWRIKSDREHSNMVLASARLLYPENPDLKRALLE